eukprot:TRINITY_DN242208_c0_g1_i1.p2 TRINITY_DN242208_c0_g1~~TRINITY_DN242208_c0_g1_i1.p2  ORF type:complete len:120 (-),score=20.59 TRINITY_DN242208_c0_g1_i1:70-408(-)
MKYAAVYYMLTLGGNAAPTAEDVTAVLEKVGVEVDSEKLTRFMTEVEGKDIKEMIAAGKDKLSVVASAAPAAGGAAPAASGETEAAVEESETEEESEEGGMGGLFGDSDSDF